MSVVATPRKNAYVPLKSNAHIVLEGLGVKGR